MMANNAQYDAINNSRPKSLINRIGGTIASAKKKIVWRRIGVVEGILLVVIAIAAGGMFAKTEQQFVGDTIYAQGSSVQIAITMTAVIIMIIIVRVLVGRLHDVGRTSLYLLLLLTLIPLTIYTSGTPLADAPFIILLIFASIILIIPGQAGANRYGPAPRCVNLRLFDADLIAAFGILLVIGSVALYMALESDEVYVGRNKYNLSDSVSDNTIKGDILTQCYGFRGITAFQDNGRGIFARDGYEKGTFLFVLKPNNSIDIVFHSPQGTTSYQDDGFNVRYQGLSLEEEKEDRGAGFVSYKVDLSNLLIAATSRNADNKVMTMVQFSFGSYPDKYSYKDNRALMTQTTRSASILDMKISIRGRLMIGDCDSHTFITREANAAIPVADLP